MKKRFMHQLHKPMKPIKVRLLVVTSSFHYLRYSRNCNAVSCLAEVIGMPSTASDG
jgi:hypothetical protein